LPRVLTTAFLVALLAATAGAFALTGRAKLERSPVYATRVHGEVFSPACDCDRAVARIDFRLRSRDRVSVWVERDGERMLTLVPGRTFAAGAPGVSLVFDGITDAGLTLPDGLYRPVVHLGRQHRTIELPDLIELDTKAPAVRAPRRVYTRISPDGDGHNDVYRVHYRLNEPGHGVLLVDGRQVARAPVRSRQGALVWNGRIDGRTARRGPHVLKITAEDAAGNRARPFPFAVVTVRYVALGRSRVVARPGTHFAILVQSDAPKVAWLFNRARGAASPGTLRFRAPRKRGVYRLYVTDGEHAAKALVVVA
jgi:hypothetical protein